LALANSKSELQMTNYFNHMHSPAICIDYAITQAGLIAVHKARIRGLVGDSASE